MEAIANRADRLGGPLRCSTLVVCALAMLASAAWAQDRDIAASLLPASQSPFERLAGQFLLAKRDPGRARVVESRVRDAILQAVDDGASDIRVECRESICRAGIYFTEGGATDSPLWVAKGSSQIQPWETSPLVELAEKAGFESVASLKGLNSEKTSSLILYLSNAD